MTLTVSDGDCSDSVTATVTCSGRGSHAATGDQGERGGVERRYAGRLGRASARRHDRRRSLGVRVQGQRRHARLYRPGGHDDRSRRVPRDRGGRFRLRSRRRRLGPAVRQERRLRRLAHLERARDHDLRSLPERNRDLPHHHQRDQGGAANDCSVPVKFTEVESNGGTPGDWAELYNTGSTTVDLSGFVFKDNDDTHLVLTARGDDDRSGRLPRARGSGFRLRARRQRVGALVRHHRRAGRFVQLDRSLDHDLTAAAPTRAALFISTVSSSKGAANACVPTGPTSSAWPGQDDVSTVDGTGVFGGNLSGLTYEPATASSPAVLWAVRNAARATLYRLIFDGTIWTPDTANGWGAGKALHYTTGLNNVDSEGVTLGEPGSSAIYVATERNNDASTVSRLERAALRSGRGRQRAQRDARVEPDRRLAGWSARTSGSRPSPGSPIRS